jgi:hypothetical protein
MAQAAQVFAEMLGQLDLDGHVQDTPVDTQEVHLPSF